MDTNAEKKQKLLSSSEGIQMTWKSEKESFTVKMLKWISTNFYLSLQV